MNIPDCNGNGVYIPPMESCDDCSSMRAYLDSIAAAVNDIQNDIIDIQGDITALQTASTGLSNRIGAIETLIGNKTNTEIAMVDENDNEASITVLAE